MVREHRVDASTTEPQRAPDELSEDSPADLATLNSNRPLEIVDEEVGSDPYNHTGRFSTPVE